MGELVTYKVPSHMTGGAYSLFEVTTQPGARTPPHIQHREDESFYLLEGEYEFLIGGETLRVGAGSLLYIPKGTLHAHKNVGEGVVGRMLVTQTPGGLYEHFFEEVWPESLLRSPLPSLGTTNACKLGTKTLPALASFENLVIISMCKVHIVPQKSETDAQGGSHGNRSGKGRGSSGQSDGEARV